MLALTEYSKLVVFSRTEMKSEAAETDKRDVMKLLKNKIYFSLHCLDQESPATVLKSWHPAVFQWIPVPTHLHQNKTTHYLASVELVEIESIWDIWFSHVGAQMYPKVAGHELLRSGVGDPKAWRLLWCLTAHQILVYFLVLAIYPRRFHLCKWCFSILPFWY